MTSPMSENMLPLRLLSSLGGLTFLNPMGANDEVRSRNPLTKQYCQISLHAYAVGRLKAISLANGEGRTDDEEGPGGWDGAEVHKNENRQQPMLWITDHAVIFTSTDSLSIYIWEETVAINSRFWHLLNNEKRRP